MSAPSEYDPYRKIDRLRTRLQNLRRSIEDMDNLLDSYLASEQALRESEERFRLLVAAVKDYAIFMLDPQGHVMTWNVGAERIKGYRAEEIIGQHFSVFYPPEAKATDHPANELRIAIAEGRYEEEGWRVRKDGTYFWANVVITALFDDKGTLRGFGKVTRDMTERKLSDEALRQSEERFRLMVQSVRDYAIFMLDPQGHVMTWNVGAERIKGYRAEEIIGQHFSVFYPPEVKATDHPANELRIAIAEGRYEEEGWRVRKDGTYFWANVVITALLDDKGTLRGFGKVTRDLTERKMAEEQREQLRLNELQLEREREERLQMETMMRVRDEFLTITSHELRTPVTSILGYAQLLKRRSEQSEFTSERLQQPVRVVLEQAQRLDRLTTALLDLSRLEQRQFVMEYRDIDLGAVVQRVVDHLQLLSEQHTLSVHVPRDPVVIEGDELRLEQILFNLVQNAIKYSPSGGTIRIELQQEQDEARLKITDQGIGIPPEDLPLVFDRFFRAANSTQQHMSGMGVGLYIVKELVALHNGTIDVQSVVGAGSTFTITFPLKP